MPRSLKSICSISAKDMDGMATPTGYPDIKLDVTVEEVSKVLVGPGNFDLQLSLDCGTAGQSSSCPAWPARSSLCRI